jgi:ketosteroid isomerase-like protein
MSRENVKVVRGAYEAFAKGELDAAVDSVLDPEIEWRTRENLPDSSTFRGHEGVLEWFATWLSAWEDFALEAEEFLPVGDYVVVSTRQSGRGVDSGVEVAFRETHVWKLREGKAIQVVEYAEKADALKAVGLE